LPERLPSAHRGRFPPLSIAVGLLLGALLWMPPAPAAPDSEGCESQANGSASVIAVDGVRDLLRWIGTHTAYDVDPVVANPPVIVLCDPGEIIDYAGKPFNVAGHIRGLCDVKCARISLVRPWRSDDVDNLSTLLHELVHFIQFNSASWPCPQETEYEAYKLQEAWLREHGREPGFNWAKIHLESSCTRRDIHP